MATALKLVFLLLCSYHSLIAHARHCPSYRILATGSLSPDAVCTELKAILPSSGGTTLPLHHRHGPCSPLPNKVMPSLDEILRRDELRANYVQRMFSDPAKNGTRDQVQQSEAATVPTALGSSLETFDYLVTVGIGSPAATQTMVIDTGSDVSWVQCVPCSQCHSQADQLFDPTSSSTYWPFSCDSPECTRLQLGDYGNSSQCQYIVRYGDGSSTTGTYGSDTFTLGNSAISNFQFGCSNSNDDSDQTDGLLGLGGGRESLVSQTAGTFGTAFSYCLPPTPASTGFLTLGATSGGSTEFVTTPMIRSKENPTYYQVILEAITVGGTRLDVPSSAFSGGTLMDSGTVLTWLPPTMYSALSSAFKAGMTQYPPARGTGTLETCFDFSGLSSGSPPSVPSISLVFAGGAVVNLDYHGIMLDNCLAFTANDKDSALSIVGNVQQRTFEVLYDVGDGKVGFRAAAC